MTRFEKKQLALAEKLTKEADAAKSAYETLLVRNGFKHIKTDRDPTFVRKNVFIAIAVETGVFSASIPLHGMHFARRNIPLSTENVLKVLRIIAEVQGEKE